MLHFIKNIVKINDNFSVDCLFNKGEVRHIDLSSWVKEFVTANDGWASNIGDLAYFRKVQLDSYGTLCWDNQLDFCPDVLYDMSTAV
jgi:hypothetical protein